jgi:hypothetical protein
LFLRLVDRIRINLLWRVVGVVRARPGLIILHQIYCHTFGDFHGGVSELMTTCVGRSLKSTVWSSRRSLDLATSVSRCEGVVHRYPRQHWWPGRGDFSGVRMLARRWWICHSSLTSSIGGGESWSKTAHGRPLVNVLQRHIPRCVRASPIAFF